MVFVKGADALRVMSSAKMPTVIFGGIISARSLMKMRKRCSARTDLVVHRVRETRKTNKVWTQVKLGVAKKILFVKVTINMHSSIAAWHVFSYVNVIWKKD